jgi:hypothetical protein
MLEYGLHAIGVVLMIVWISTIGLVLLEQEYQLAGVLLIMFLSISAMWLYSMVE